MESTKLTNDEKRALLSVARSSIGHFLGIELAEPEIDSRLRTEKRGAFVTLREGGELRGCIGYVEPFETILHAVRQLAIKAASEDPRFDVVTPDEFHALTVEVSVLTPLRRIQKISEIEIGRHGLVVERGTRRGLLLPEVALEAGWEAREFVSHCCLKAGLPLDSWMQSGTKLFVFETEHFSEHDSITSQGVHQ